MSKNSNKRAAVEPAPKSISQFNTSFDVLSYTYGKSTNVIKYKDEAFTYCLKELGQVAYLIRDSARSVPSPIPEPIGANPFSAGNDPYGAKKAAYLRKVSNREDKIDDLQTAEPKLFAHLWNNTSKESRAQIERVSQPLLDYERRFIYHDAAGEPCAADEAGAVRVMERWDDIFGRDALSLIRRINTTHLAPDTGVIELTQEQTRMRYEDRGRLSVSIQVRISWTISGDFRTPSMLWLLLIYLLYLTVLKLQDSLSILIISSVLLKLILPTGPRTASSLIPNL